MSRCESLDIVLTIEELSIDGEVCLGRCCRSTAYRDVKRVNEFLSDNKYEWRVKLKIEKGSALPYSLIAYIKEADLMDGLEEETVK